MAPAVHTFAELEHEECRRLLTTTPLGRLGFTEAALPRILPVHFAVRGDEIVVATPAGSKVACAGRGDIVAFEADDYDPVTREGWTVGVVGPTRLISDRAETELLDALDLAPWTADQERHYFTVRMHLVRGRRLLRQEASVPVAS